MRNSKELMEFVQVWGQNKATRPMSKIFALSVMAGMFIAFGAIFFTVVTSYGGNLGLYKILGGLVFSTGLVLVVLAGAELFTGNNLLIIPLMNKQVKLSELFNNWLIVYLGNFVGAIIVVALFFATELYASGSGEIGMRTLAIADMKVNLSFLAAFSRAILCNMLVCLAIWLTMVAKTFSGKVLGIIFPITAFVAMGFEHSIANMYFIPAGIYLRNFASADFWTAINSSGMLYEQLTMGGFLFPNLVAVTLGNIIGGSLFVGFNYWFIHREE